MKYIQLTRGHQAVVDDEDFEYLDQFNWYENNGYALSYLGSKEFGKPNPNKQPVRMHRLVMENPQGLEVDHKNLNKLDNRKSNLRPCTRQQNAFNVTARSKSGYKGVYRYGKTNFKAFIRIGGKSTYLGRRETAKEAYKLYKSVALRIHGEFVNV